MEFVYDRSAQDVLDRTKKGVLGAEHLNRIEGNIKAIAELIAVPVFTKEWIVGGLPRESDYKRIRDNTELIREGYGIRKDTPIVPVQPLNHYEKWNDIEHILFDVSDIFERTTAAQIRCTEGFAGEGIGVI